MLIFKYFIGIAILIFEILFNYKYLRNNGYKEEIAKLSLTDTTLSRQLQTVLNKGSIEIILYNKYLFEKKTVENDLVSAIMKVQNFEDSVNFYNGLITLFLKNLSQEGEILDINKPKNILDFYYKMINKYTISKAESIINLNDFKSKYSNLESKLNDKKNIYNSILNEITNLFKRDSISKKIQLTFNNVSYTCVIANSSQDEVKIIANTSKLLAPLKSYWKNNDKMFCILNGGMYLADGSAQGLLIQDHNVKSNLDTSTISKSGNFYLYPNGVFYIDTNNKYNITTTLYFRDSISNKMRNIKYATQSGPILVNNNEIHKEFNFNSQNKNIRNGVGVKELRINDKAFFVITSEPVNFYDMSIFFKDVLGCKQALYLDGAISKLYYENENEMFGDLGGNLGPVITISKLK